MSKKSKESKKDKRRKNLQNSSVWLSLGLLLVASNTLALTSDRQKPMNIKANRVEINDKKGESVYRGNVVIVQGTMRIEANKVTVYHSKTHKIQKIVAVGKPSKYKQLPDNKTQYVHAIANRMVYTAKDDLIVMTDNAKFNQGRNVFKSKKINYYVKADKVKTDARVSITIEPQAVKKKK